MLMMSAPCLRREPALEEQRLDARVAAAERAIQRGGVLRPAARKDHVAEALAVLARHPAVLLEPGVRVVVEHLGPEIRVVAGRVAAAPDVREVRRAIARRHLVARRR